MHKTIFLIFHRTFLVITGIIFSSVALDARPLRIGYVEFPPYTYTLDEGTSTGILFNKSIKAIERAGYKWTAESYPGQRLFKNISRGYTDLFLGIQGIPALSNTTFASNTAIGSIQMRIYYIGNKKPIFSKEKLKGKSIIIVQGYGYTDKNMHSWARYIKNRDNGIPYEEAQDHVNAFAKLKAGRASYLLAYTLPAEQALQKIRINNLRYNIIHTVKMYLIISKKTKNARTILRSIEKEFIKLH